MPWQFDFIFTGVRSCPVTTNPIDPNSLTEPSTSRWPKTCNSPAKHSGPSTDTSVPSANWPTTAECHPIHIRLATALNLPLEKGCPRQRAPPFCAPVKKTASCSDESSLQSTGTEAFRRTKYVSWHSITRPETNHTRSSLLQTGCHRFENPSVTGA